MMTELNVVNLIQAGICSVGLLGALLMWQTKPNEFRGISLLLAIMAIAAFTNILEESGITREIYLVSPVFILLYGPGVYIAAKLVIQKCLDNREYWHFLPVIPVIFFTSYTSTIIAIGTFWRLAYALLTIKLLLNYKNELEQERSDSDEFSLSWLVAFLIITASFNCIDLLRLNIQHLLPVSINVFGQGINNAFWLLAIMYLVLKFQVQVALPRQKLPREAANTDFKNSDNELTTFQPIFEDINKLMLQNQWFLKPRLTLSDVSELTGLQTRDISRAINLVTKKSFNEYVNQYRIQFVCNEIKVRPSQSLLAIATDAGFTSKASFNKVFKQELGMTPSQFKAADQSS